MANWQHCPAVERHTQRNGGLWVFTGTDVPLYRLYESLASGMTVGDFAERFGVGIEQAVEALQYQADELHDYRLDYLGPVPYARAPRTENAAPDDAMWRNCSLVEQAGGRLGGAWVFKHTRLALYVLYYHLAGGSTIEEFDEWFGMNPRNVAAVLEHEAKELREAWSAYADIV